MKVLMAAIGCGVALSAAAADKTPAPEVRAYVNESCVVADEPWLQPETTASADTFSRAGPLTALVVGKLAEVLVTQTIKATAGRISAGAERKDTKYAFARDTNLYRAEFTPQPKLALNARLGCITLVAARFAEGGGCQAGYQPRLLAEGLRARPESEWRSSRVDGSVANVLRRSDICVVGTPASVYESRFEFSPDGTAWRLVDGGYHIDSLLSVSGKRAERHVFYTLEVLQPTGTAARGESLTTGIVTLGPVRAGSTGDGAEKPGPWLRVPALSIEARRGFETRLAVHQESWAEIGALERALVRNARVADEVRQRRASAKGDLGKALGVEETRLAVQRVTLDAELKARREEYAGLPRERYEFMPVAIEIGLTETRSEQPALQLVAEVMRQGSGFIGTTAGQQVAVVSRSVNTEVSEEDAGAKLERARAEWHDARVEGRIADSVETRDAATHRVNATYDAYREVRRDVGLPEEPGR